MDALININSVLRPKNGNWIHSLSFYLFKNEFLIVNGHGTLFYMYICFWRAYVGLGDNEFSKLD